MKWKKFKSFWCDPVPPPTWQDWVIFAVVSILVLLFGIVYAQFDSMTGYSSLIGRIVSVIWDYFHGV